MNLYDKDDGFKCFTLDEANAFLPDVIAVTQEAASELEKFRREFEAEKPVDRTGAQGKFKRETARILESWSEKVVALSVYPKGYFTVDFKTHIPDTLFCWTFGEREISYTHKIYETFKERRSIQDSKLVGFDDALN